jgi:hypothetical protein
LTLVLRTRRVKKRNYAACVTTSRHPSARAAKRKFRLCRTYALSRAERDARFDRVGGVYRSRVAYRRIYPFTGPGRYIACWTWADSCARDGRRRIGKIVFWIKRSGRVIVRRPQ